MAHRQTKDTDLHVFYLNKNCNLRCDYCYEKDKSSEMMSKETAKALIDELMARYADEPDRVVRIMLFGGEPFINWDTLIDCVKYTYEQYTLKDRRVWLLIITNGTLVTPERARQLFRYNKILNIEVSIDGNKETQNKHRKFPSGLGSFDIVAKNAKGLLQYFPFATARMVIEDVDRYYDNVVFLHGLGFKQFCIQALRFNDGRVHTQEYIDKFMAETELVKEFFAKDPHVIINDIQYPNPTRSQGSGYYHYFLPNGGAIKQPKYIEAEFQHFTKGVDADYNLLRNGVSCDVAKD